LGRDLRDAQAVHEHRCDIHADYASVRHIRRRPLLAGA